MATTLTQHPARDYCLAPSRAADLAAGGRYQKLFPELEPLRTDETLLHALGVMGGACDGSQPAAQGGDDGDTTAGWPFFGQFVAPVTPREHAGALYTHRFPCVRCIALTQDGTSRMTR